MVIIFIFFAHVSLLVEKFSIYMTTACALLSFLFSYNNTHIFFCMTIYFFLITCFVYLYFSFLAFSYILFPSNHRSWIVYYFSYGIMLWLRYRSKWWSIFFILCIMMHVLQPPSSGFVLSTLSLYTTRCLNKLYRIRESRNNLK